MLEELKCFWVRELGGIFERTLLLDTKSLTAVVYKRDKLRSDFIGSVDYG